MAHEDLVQLVPEESVSLVKTEDRANFLSLALWKVRLISFISLVILVPFGKMDEGHLLFVLDDGAEVTPTVTLSYDFWNILSS